MVHELRTVFLACTVLMPILDEKSCSSNLNFRGVEKDDSEFIDISEAWPWEQQWLRSVLSKDGFANYYNKSRSKLLPCPRGTFVNISDTRPTCKDCPAGKLTQILCIKLAHSCIQESNTNCKNRFKVSELCLECMNLILKCIIKFPDTKGTNGASKTLTFPYHKFLFSFSLFLSHLGLILFLVQLVWTAGICNLYIVIISMSH